MQLYGLIYHVESTTEEALVPLQNVAVEANIVDMISEVTISQTYKNLEEHIIDASYRFPIYEGAAICGFEAEIDGKRVIKGVVKESKEAAKEYKEAVSQGFGAYLLEEQFADVFVCSIGNVSPGQTVIIRITYVSELKHDAETEKIRFVLPTVVSPRYGNDSLSPLNPTANDGKELQSSQKPKNSSLSSQAKYTLEVSIICRMTSQITSIESPSHLISTELNINGDQKIAKIALAQAITYLEKDFILIVKSNELDKPRAYIEYNPDHETNCVMLTLVPKFSLNATMCELIFVVDRSGSMMGGPIEKASQALQLILRSLPEDCVFNVVSFGSHFDSIFTKSQPYSETTFNQALDYAKKMEANYGGTEIYPVLDSVFKQRKKNMATSVLFLTDGEVWNVDQVVELVNKATSESNEHPLRLFALGIGSSVSHHLVESVARAGKGYAQFVTNEERLDKKVIAMVKNAIKPPISDYKIKWSDAPIFDNQFDSEGAPKNVEEKPIISFYNSNDNEKILESEPILPDFKISQAPFNIPPIYSGARVVIYAILQKGVEPLKTITLSGQSLDGPMQLQVPVDPVILKGSKVHRLAARKLIQDLEEGNSFLHYHSKLNGKDLSPSHIRKKVVSLGVTFNLVSRYTSFIAIDKETKTAIGTSIPIKPTRIVPPQSQMHQQASSMPFGGSIMACSTSRMAHIASPMAFGGFSPLVSLSSENKQTQRIAFGSSPIGIRPAPPPVPSAKILSRPTSKAEFTIKGKDASEATRSEKSGVNPKNQSVETLYAFLGLQTFDGRIEFKATNNPEFSSLFHQSENFSKFESTQWNIAAWMAYLQIVMSEFTQEWELCYEKAERALKILISKDASRDSENQNSQLEEILVSARGWVSKWFETD